MFLVIVLSLHYINTNPRATAKIAKTHLKNMCTSSSNVFPCGCFCFSIESRNRSYQRFHRPKELRAFIMGSDQSKQFLDLRGDPILFA